MAARLDSVPGLAAEPLRDTQCTRGRSTFQRVGSFDVGRDARELFGLRPDNLFMIKPTDWLNP